MTKFIKSVLTSKWLLVVFEYELVKQKKARISIRRFIEIVYSKKRLHSSLGYIPPEEFEARFTLLPFKKGVGFTKLKGQLLLNHNNALKIDKNSVSAIS